MPIILSKTYDAVRKRIARLPKLAEGVADAQRRRDAKELIRIWREGLVGNRFGLRSLQPATIKRKARRGYSNPTSPLYGLGLDGARTYVKGMRVFRTNRGWVVRMIDGRHHESKISLKRLFNVHEYGMIINVRGRMITIPARPAMAAAYAAVMREIADRDPSAEVQKAAFDFAITGGSKIADKAFAEVRRPGSSNA